MKSFPYTYENKTELFFNDESETSAKNFFSDIAHEFEKNGCQLISVSKDFISAQTRNTLFAIEYSFDIMFTNKPEEQSIEYKIYLEKLLLVIAVSVIFSGLIAFFSVSGFLIFAVVFSIIFYLVNLAFVNIFIQRVIFKNARKYLFDFNKSEYISKAQSEWINNPNKCPACGCDLTDLILDCPECGLKVRKNRYSVPLDVSKYHQKNIKYHFKK